MRRGQAAFAANDLVAAQDWFDRGVRYAPTDGTAKLSLASVLLARGDLSHAARLFAEVAAEFDAEAAWLGLAAARVRLGDTAGATVAAATLLGRFAVTGPTAALVTELAGAGWCGFTPEGDLTVHLANRRSRAVILCDGAPCRTVPNGARAVRVLVAGRELLGSPIDVAAQRRVEGWVEPAGTGVRGWAWFPGNPTKVPRLIASSGSHRVVLLADGPDVPAPRALMQPRGFAIDNPPGPVSVATEDGQVLAGCPFDVGAAPSRAVAVAAAAARVWPLDRVASASPLDIALAGSPVPVGTAAVPAIAPADPERPVAIVIPAYRGAAETAACLDALAATITSDTAIHVVDDASPERDLANLLDARAAVGAIVLHRLPRNAGFPAAANYGLRAAAFLNPSADVVLLNNDTVPTPGWLAALRRAVHAAPDVGSATPLSNDASIMSYPVADGGPMPTDVLEQARLCATVAQDLVVALPTAVGFCAYLRRECLEAVGVFRDDAFAQGYGEENDWCLRAADLGWRHVGVPGAYVAHVGGRSFGAARASLTARNLDVLEALHPGYHAAVSSWIAADPLRPIRRALDLARLDGRKATTLLVTHDGGGGVERHIEARSAALRDALVLRPLVDFRPVEQREDTDLRYRPGMWRLDIGAPADPGFPNLVFAVEEVAELVDVLRRFGVERVEVHHLLGHDHRAMTLPALLGVPYEIVAHDHSWFCARVTPVAAGRYCGEPDIQGCVDCVADHGSRLEEAITPPALVARSARDLAGASAVLAPSGDAANRLRRHFPQVIPRVVAHEKDGGFEPRPTAGARVCVVGGIGIEKGYDVLLACARDAAARALDLSFRVVGHTTDDARLLDTGRVAITGPFERAEAVELIRAQRAALGFLPSICPETWCYALTDLWAGGLPVAAFDIGAQGERVRATGRGWVLPLGLPARAINAALIARAREAGGQIAR